MLTPGTRTTIILAFAAMVTNLVSMGAIVGAAMAVGTILDAPAPYARHFGPRPHIIDIPNTVKGDFSNSLCIVGRAPTSRAEGSWRVERSGAWVYATGSGANKNYPRFNLDCH